MVTAARARAFGCSCKTRAQNQGSRFFLTHAPPPFARTPPPPSTGFPFDTVQADDVRAKNAKYPVIVYSKTYCPVSGKRALCYVRVFFSLFALPNADPLPNLAAGAGTARPSISPSRLQPTCNRPGTHPHSPDCPSPLPLSTIPPQQKHSTAPR